MSASAGQEPRTTKLEIRVFGRFEVLRDGQPIPEGAWGRRKAKALMKVLLTDPGHVFSQDQLIEALSEAETSRNAVATLYSRVSELRRALEPDLKRGNESQFIIRRGHGYYFNVDTSCRIDASEFLAHHARGQEHQQAGQHAEAIAVYNEAISLYRGDFLEADHYEEWTLGPRAEWRERYINVLMRQAEAYAHLGDCHQAAAVCRKAFTLDPWRESLLQQLMTYLQTAGERSEALQAYRKGVEALKEELDVEPSAETQALYQEILNSGTPSEQVTYDKQRLVVLPMHSISPDPEDEYFADGMTEELIHKLSQIHDLKVIAQTSALLYKNTKKTIAQIGRELNIGTVIEGSVRKAGDTVRITVQLVDVESEEHLLSLEYDRPLRDVFAIQSDVAQQVAGALRVQLADGLAEQMAVEPTTNPDAHTAYLKGRYFSEKRTSEGLAKAGKYFDQAIELDPSYALAHSGRAGNYMLHASYSLMTPKEAYAQARVAAEKALEIDDTVAEAHAELALLRFFQDRDPSAAEDGFKRAISLNPSSADAHRLYGILLSRLARLDEALQEIERALELDPLSIITNANLGSKLSAAGHVDEAIEVLQKTLELDPSSAHAHVYLADCYRRKGMFEEALAELAEVERAKTLPKTTLMPILGGIYVAMGREDKARKILKESIEESKHGCVSLFFPAALCCVLGEVNQCFQYLEVAYEEGDENLSMIKVSTDFDSVRSDPRFVSLLQRLGLDDSST